MAKKKAESFVRMTISIPAGVRKSMDRCSTKVNWSAVAAEAFSAAAVRHSQVKRSLKVITTDVARLRNSLEDLQTSSYRDGREAGFEWAAKYAEAIELKRLERYRVEFDEVWDKHFCGPEDGQVKFIPLGPIGSIVEDMIGMRGEADYGNDIEPFLEGALGEQHEDLTENGGYMHGFFEGALEAWYQAKEQM
jgi:hypothetical protein